MLLVDKHHDHTHLFSGTDVLLRMPTKMPINMLVILVKHSHVINKQDLVSYHFDLVRMLNEHDIV